MILNGNIIVNNPKKADIIIFVACSVVSKAAKVNLDMIKKFQKYDAELIVAGCRPGSEQDKLKTIFNGKTIVTKEIDKIGFFSQNINIVLKILGTQIFHLKILTKQDF